MEKLRSHIKSDTIKWIVVGVILVALIAAVIGLAVKLNRRTTDERLGAEAYSIGTITDEGEIDKTVKTSIYTRDLIRYSDITEITVYGDIDYVIAFYNKSGKFIEKRSTFTVSTGDDGSFYSCRIIITPKEDEEVTITEVVKYANMLEVRVNK